MSLNHEGETMSKENSTKQMEAPKPLREQVADILFDMACAEYYGSYDIACEAGLGAADRILALPAIAEALKQP